MTPEDIAWSAGLFEGEGSIEIARPPRSRTGVRLHVGMTDLDVLEKFFRIVGCGSVTEMRSASRIGPRRKKAWYWRTGRAAECERLLHAWRPHFGTRRSARVAEALEFLAAKEYERHRTCWCGKHFYAKAPDARFCSQNHGHLWRKWHGEVAA